jgi:hypothetical protein
MSIWRVNDCKMGPDNSGAWLPLSSTRYEIGLAVHGKVAHILLDGGGGVVACSKDFQWPVSGAELSEDSVALENVFPVGFRPRELLAGPHPEEERSCVLASPDGRVIPVALRMQPIGSNWLLTVQRLDSSQKSCPEMLFLEEQDKNRTTIATYLHDTVCQSLVAVSLLLAKMERDPVCGSSPVLSRAMSVCDCCSHDLRALMRVLSPPCSEKQALSEPEVGGGTTNEIFGSYVTALREQAGLNVYFRSSVEGSPCSSRSASPIFAAALQIWAESALTQRPSRGAHRTATLISLSCGSLLSDLRKVPGTVLEFLTDAVDDPAIGTLLASCTLRACLQVSQGSIETRPGHSGTSARLWLGAGWNGAPVPSERMRSEST